MVQLFIFFMNGKHRNVIRLNYFIIYIHLWIVVSTEKKSFEKKMMKYFVVGLHTYIIFGKWGKKCANRKLKNKMQKKKQCKNKTIFLCYKRRKKSAIQEWKKSLTKATEMKANFKLFISQWIGFNLWPHDKFSWTKSEQ